jgi:hypothetical protein
METTTGHTPFETWAGRPCFYCDGIVDTAGNICHTQWCNRPRGTWGANQSGWQCPQCGRCYGPSVEECKPCNDHVMFFYF